MIMLSCEDGAGRVSRASVLMVAKVEVSRAPSTGVELEVSGHSQAFSKEE